jgi:hypothetical protein
MIKGEQPPQPDGPLTAAAVAATAPVVAGSSGIAIFSNVFSTGNVLANPSAINSYYLQTISLAAYTFGGVAPSGEESMAFGYGPTSGATSSIYVGSLVINNADSKQLLFPGTFRIPPNNYILFDIHKANTGGNIDLIATYGTGP